MPLNNNKPKKRRWLQFGLRTFLLLPVLFGVGWWWVGLPGRAINRFNRLVAEEKYEEAEAAIVNRTDWLIDVDAESLRFTDSFVTPDGMSNFVEYSVPLEPDPPSFLDVILARRRISTPFYGELWVERSTVTFVSAPFESVWERSSEPNR